MLNISQFQYQYGPPNATLPIFFIIYLLIFAARAQNNYQLIITTSTSMASTKADYTFEILQ